jgi:putative endonuclease
MGPGVRRDDSCRLIRPFRTILLMEYAFPMSGHVYILASRRHGTIYIGCMTGLPKRIYEHREGLVRGFTRKYGVKRLVHVETYHDISDAIVRERRMKEWQRAWKVRLIERDKPDWQDIAVTLLGFEPLGPESPRRRPGPRNTAVRE